MAKIYGLFGSMTGKLADTVMAVRNGEQLARKYQPIVSNPSTQAQVEQRAKLKLLSQVSAVMAPYIAIRRVGTVSSRNFFTKINFRYASYSNGTAEFDVESTQLTKSVVGLPALSVTRTGTAAEVALTQGDVDLDRVVYVAFFRQSDGSLRATGSAVASTPGVNATFATTIDLRSSDQFTLVVLAYGVRDNSEAARVVFGDMVVDAEAVAKLVTSRRLTESDVTLTETRSMVVAAA